MWALSCKGTGIFFLTAEDDFSSILGYWLLALYYKGSEIFFVLPNRLVSLYLKGTDIFLLTFYCWRRFQFDSWLSTDWPYIWNVVRFSCWTFYCWRRFQFDTWLSTGGLIFVRYWDFRAGHYFCYSRFQFDLIGYRLSVLGFRGTETVGYV